LTEDHKPNTVSENGGLGGEKNFLRKMFFITRRVVTKYLDKYRFLRFAIIGGIGVPINLGLLVALKEIGLNYVVAVILATEIAMSINYLLNNYWTFNNRKISKLKGWARYALISLPFDGTSFALTVTLKETVLKDYYWGYLMAAGTGLVCAAILRYIMVKRFVWRTNSTPKNTG
jgi:dolichol-phosphate mannosyltransferase